MTCRLFLLALLLSVTSAVAWVQDPAGTEFQVNTYTTGWQYRSQVASDASGDFVVVWSSRGQDGLGSWGVFGQRYNASGAPQGSELQVNTSSDGRSPALASDATGNFVVVWRSNGQDGSSWGVFGQRYNASGAPQGSGFQVNSYTTGDQNYPAVASDPNGSFVVVWASLGQEGGPSSFGLFGQRFNAAGIPQGSEFRVSTYTTGWRKFPSAAEDASGNFVVVWGASGQDGSYYGVFGRRFNASGLPQGSEFRVNSYTTNSQHLPKVASAANGQFVVVWQSSGQDGSGVGVFGQRFDASGLPQGSEFRVNSRTSWDQLWPAVTADANGNFVVAWTSEAQDGSSYGVFGQRFNASGAPQGNEFRVNTHTADTQAVPAVASDGTGNFVVVWESNGQDGSDYGIFGQRYGSDVIFKDGFQAP